MGDFINKNLNVFVSTHSDGFLKYEGYCVAENDDTITLENAIIKAAIAMKATKFVVGGEAGIIYEENIKRAVINKKYIISCNEK